VVDQSIQRIMDCSPEGLVAYGKKFMAEQKVSDEIYNRIDKAFQELVDLACNGHSSANRKIAEFACDVVETMEDLYSYSDSYKRLAGEKDSWPVMVPAKHAAREKRTDLVMDEILYVGFRVDLNLGKGKPFSTGTPTTYVAYRLYHIIAKLREQKFPKDDVPDDLVIPETLFKAAKTLPLLSKETISAWWPVCDELLTLLYGKDVSTDYIFREMSIVRNSEVYLSKKNADIRKAIKQSLKTIAPDPEDSMRLRKKAQNGIL
jgi:hypothetical protein